MKVVADTNVVVSGLLWHGPSRQVLDAARAGSIQLFTTAVLLAELQDVLMRPKFAERLTRASVTADQLVRGYGALAGLVQPAPIPAVIISPSHPPSTSAQVPHPLRHGPSQFTIR